MTKLSGIIAPILTPFEAQGAIATDLWIAHAKWVLDRGAHYLAPFGTTGEALSISTGQRIVALQALVDAGIPAACLMPGTGTTAIGETLELTRHAVGLGVAAVMVLPSFFYTGATEDGHFRFFDELVTGVASPALKICLYNIPQNSGVPVTPALAGRLARLHPGAVVAYKDSSGNWDNTRAVLRAAPSLAVFPGSERFLTQGLSEGCAGCISATVNVNAKSIREVYDAAIAGRDVSAQDAKIISLRRAVKDAGLIRGLKALVAVRTQDQRWLNLQPPLRNSSAEIGSALLADIGDQHFAAN